MESTTERVGVWLIGARGSIATTTVAGHGAIVRGLTAPVGMVTARSVFDEVSLPELGSLVFGGHEIKKGHMGEIAGPLLEACGVPFLAQQLGDVFEAAERNIRPGVVRGAGEAISEMAEAAIPAQTDAEAVRLIRADLDAFKSAEGITQLVVVNVASTEPPMWLPEALHDLDALRGAMDEAAPCLPPSALYAFAAFEGGDAYINFTPSVGSRLPPLERLAEEKGAVHGGSDGKTGETLVKSVLAELFARRGLEVRSWYGTNILGNEDGRVLDDPRNKATKIKSKDHLLGKMLHPQPYSRVGIDYVPSLGERKVAWDYIHFAGFLGGGMSMQFTWDGVDSLLAAPLVLDLVRLAVLAQRRGEAGVLSALAPFFKDPMGTDEQRLVSQDEALLAWALGEP
ncbi:MAG: inositol-3-phosphate synthase [Bradymonadia bacterium]